MSARDFLFLAPLFVGLVIWGGVSYELHDQISGVALFALDVLVYTVAFAWAHVWRASGPTSF